MKPRFTKKEITDATIEAIYWWNRNEFHYHRYFSNLDKIYKQYIKLLKLK